MAMVVCFMCHRFVRTIPPYNNSYKVRGLCAKHLEELRRKSALSRKDLNKMSDILESTLKKVIR